MSPPPPGAPPAADRPDGGSGPVVEGGHDAASGPVTVVGTRHVKPGREPDYEAWLARLLRDAATLPGYLGVTVQRPAPTGPRAYTSVFRFDTVVPQPSRVRMAVLMIIVVYGLVLSIGALVGSVMGGAPPALRLLVTIIIEVALMTWVLMPRLTRWLARWIYPTSRAVA